jgi:class 3 adenylate cyclase
MAHLPDLAVGIDAGAALVGVVGEGRAMSLLMQGPPIVRAAELQAATRTLGSPILLSEAAAAAASGPAKARLTLVEGAEGVWALNPHG